MTFLKGESGNLAGRPRGIRDRRALLTEQLMEDDAEAVVRTALDLAKKGDGTALRLCMERICPRLKERPVAFALPPLTKTADAVAAMAAITEGVAEGALTAAEGAELAKMVQAFAQTLTTTDFEERLARLEEIEKDRAERSMRKLR